VPLTTISKIVKVGGQSSSGETSYSMQVFTKDMRILHFSFPKVKRSRREFLTTLNKLIPESTKDVFAFSLKYTFPDTVSYYRIILIFTRVLMVGQSITQLRTTAE
jgi:hypothetical protein